MVLIDLIRAVRLDRLGLIRAKTLPWVLADGAVAVVHSTPVRRDQRAINVDVGSVDHELAILAKSITVLV